MSLLKKIYWNIAQKRHNVEKSIHELKSIGIEITGSCNLQCKHCYMDSTTNNNNDLSTQEWKDFFKKLKKDFGTKPFIQLTGGEILFRKDIFEILKFLKELDFKIALITNGTLLNEKKTKELKKYVSGLSISLDGFKDSHNSLRNADVFDKTLENIKLCKKLDINNIFIKTSVYRKNLKELEEFYKLLKELNINTWHIFPIEPCGRAKFNQEQILSQNEYLELCSFIDKIKEDKDNKIKIKFGEESNNFIYKKTCDYCKHKLCGAGISSCSILHNGDIVKCIQDERDTINIEGNIKTDNFLDIWNNKFLNSRKKDYKSCNNHHFEK